MLSGHSQSVITDTGMMDLCPDFGAIAHMHFSFYVHLFDSRAKNPQTQADFWVNCGFRTYGHFSRSHGKEMVENIKTNIIYAFIVWNEFYLCCVFIV